MKLIQLNIWNGRLLNQVLEFLKDEQPDFLCLQEVYSSEIHNRTHNYFSSYERIDELLPEINGYFSPRLDITVFDKKVGYGNAIFSKFPVTNTETIEVSGEHHSYSKAEDYAANEGQKECFNMQRIQVTVGDNKTFCLINYHGYWEPNEYGSAVTVQLMNDVVAKILDESPRPLILSGDLNVDSNAPAMAPIHNRLRDLTKENKIETTLTQFGKIPIAACDHICISDGIDVKQFAVREELLSDHKALVLEFDLA